MPDARALFLAAGLFFPPPAIGLENNPLRGTIESMRYQNAMLDALGIARVKTEKDIAALWSAGRLERVPSSGSGYYIYPRVGPGIRFLTPAANRYLRCSAQSYHLRFDKRLKITTLCRTAARQSQLRRTGASFADSEPGERQSAHMACAAFDISLRGMSDGEILFLTELFVYDRALGKIEATLELRSRNFHVTVFQY